MPTGSSIEILDLRHFTAFALKPVLEAEGDVWKNLLHWDFQHSTRLLMQHLDNRTLPGYAALKSSQVTGYTFCVYEEAKAIIGNLFSASSASLSASTNGHGKSDAHEVERTLLLHLIELLKNSPQVDRIESQLLLHPSGTHSALFEMEGFDIYRRLFLVLELYGKHFPPCTGLMDGLLLREWREEDMEHAGQLITTAYTNHPDSTINNQYHTVHGSQRFLHNLIRYAGCGSFCPSASHVIASRDNGKLVAMILGSRVSEQSGHITQICVDPHCRRQGLARVLLHAAARGFQSVGVDEISLTVTEANTQAVALYSTEGYQCRHIFDAAVWEKEMTWREDVLGMHSGWRA